MKAVENAVLSDLVKAAEATFKYEQEQRVERQIRHMLGEAYQAAQKVERLGKELASAQEARDKALAKVEKLRGGDWSVLPEPKEEGAGEQR